VFIPPLALYVFGWLLGVGLAPALLQPLWVWLAVSALAPLVAIAFRQQTNRRNLAIAALLFGLGGARWVVAQPSLSDSIFIAAYADQGIATVEGTVIAEPDVRDTYVNLQVEADSLQRTDDQVVHSIHGALLIQVPRFPVINYGDRVQAVGDLVSPPVFEDFSYQDYLARQGMYAILRRATAHVTAASDSFPIFLLRPLYAFKAHALAALTNTFPEPQGSLLSGILLGADSAIPASLTDAFRTTGTSHIIAISGFNITIIVKVFQSLFTHLFGKGRRTLILTLLFIVLYTLLAGASASVVRAALMGGLVLIAGGFERPSNGLASLAAAAFLMTLFNPGTLFDVGFQLSLAATLGLILYADPLTNLARRALSRFLKPELAERLTHTLGEFSILTLAAQITTLPLIAFYFHQVSLISLLANLLVLPVQPQVMVFGGLAVLAAMLWQPLGALLYWLAWPFVTYTIVMVQALAQVPLASIQIDRFSVAWLVMAYGSLAALTWLATRPKFTWPKVPAVVTSLVLIVLAVGTGWAWNTYLHRPDGKLHVFFLNVGNGDSILIQTPAGRYLLIDGGPSPNQLAESLGRILPLNNRTLDFVMVAATDTRSLGGLPGLFDRIGIGQVVTSGPASQSAAFGEWSNGLISHNLPKQPAEVGQQFDLGDGARLSILDLRTNGAILRLDDGRASFLFPIGLEDAKTATELATSGQVAPATVLLIPQGGRTNSISAFYLDAVQPSAIVLPVGDGQQIDPQTLNLFAGRTLLRTDEHGTLDFATDGQQLWITAER